MKLNKKVGALIGLAALAVVGGTWAFYSQSAAITNPFNTTKFGSTMIEHFNPKDGEEWKPGATVDKKVAAKNTGDSALLVRVKMNETWSRGDKAFAVVGSINGGAFSVATLEDIEKTQINATDGLVPAYTTLTPDGNFANMDKTVVFKNLDLTAKANGQWIDGGDGYWYWNQKLAKDSSTANLMESVTLANNTDMGEYVGTYAYAIVKKGQEPGVNDWKPAKTEEEMKKAAENATADDDFFMKSENNLNPEKMGYADASYDLEVTTEFLQATKEALGEWGTTVPDAIKNLVK